MSKWLFSILWIPTMGVTNLGWIIIIPIIFIINIISLNSLKDCFEKLKNVEVIENYVKRSGSLWILLVSSDWFQSDCETSLKELNAAILRNMIAGIL